MASSSPTHRNPFAAAGAALQHLVLRHFGFHTVPRGRSDP
jgi:hypothetical protein